MTTLHDANSSNAAAKSPPARPAALAILFWFDALALSIGIAYLVNGSAHRFAAVMAYTVLCVTSVAVRTMPSIKRRPRLRCLLDAGALLVFAGGMAWATGGVQSPLLALMLLPLTAAAIALPRALYALIAGGVIATSIALTALTPDLQIASPAFAVWAISALAPMLIATTAIVVLIEQMQGAEQYIQDLSTSDALTGLYNHRTFESMLAHEHRKVERSGRSYCLLMIDVDNVKQLNETLGHDAGNQILRAVAAAIARSIRASDVAARFGGDEFVVLLADTDVPIGNAIAQRIRNNVYAGTVSVANRMVRANVHIGLAGYPKDRREPKELLVLAEQRLRHDKDLKRPRTE